MKPCFSRRFPLLELCVLLTTTSFPGYPRLDQALLDQAGFDLVPERGPLTEERMLALAGNF